MISLEEAIAAVLENAKPLPPARVRVEDAVGRTLLEEIRSGLDMPPFDKSAVDGYAVRNAEARKGLPLRNVGLIQAGDIFRGKVGPGQCVKIMTGAPVPPGADSVIMVEDSSESAGFVKFLEAAGKGANICVRGEDIRKGRLILARGAVISLSQIAVLAASGRSHVRAGALPKVSLVNTGGELAPPGEKLGRNQIYNSNGPMLSALLKSDGINAVPVIVRDRPASLRAAFTRALEADIMLISGGVSMGDFDLVPGMLKSMGVKCLFHKVRVRPGKPMFFGVKGRRLVFGIPGNPLANFLAYLAYVRPAIRRLASRPDCAPEFHTGVCAGGFEPKTQRRAMVLSSVRSKTGYSLAEVSNNGSADILALAGANGFTMVKEGGSLKKNGKARFLTWP
ncbi:MAG: molybdopterin molybdotransferase MoeA [Elusimicrobia bacterium]|nr:molybdopterin molybdotransferase MoeA [Elusimicrobiota bacterium]